MESGNYKAKAHYPYLGLRPFTPYEKDVFYGREAHIGELLSKFQRKHDSGKSHFIAILGRSGGGKSSLVQAGLLPALEDGEIPDLPNWVSIEIRPSAKPYFMVAQTLLEKSIIKNTTSTIQELGKKLQETPDSLHKLLTSENSELRETVDSSKQLSSQEQEQEQHLLIYIDQFEELFRYKGYTEKESIESFVEFLLHSAKHDRIWVLISMRGEYLQDCEAFPQLIETINAGLYLLPRMNNDELKRVISWPAGFFDDKVDDGLVKKLLSDFQATTSEEEDAYPERLPLLQHALDRIWLKARGSMNPVPNIETAHVDEESRFATMKIEHYEAVAEIPKNLPFKSHSSNLLHQCLLNHLEECFSQFDEYEQHLVSIIFRALTQKDIQTDRIVRRPVSIRELAKIANIDSEKVSSLIENIRGHLFLLPLPPQRGVADNDEEMDAEIFRFGGEELSEDSIIDVVHESLIQHWPRLNLWIKEEQESERMYRILEDRTSLWVQEHEDKAFLLKDDLQIYWNWFHTSKINSSWSERYENQSAIDSEIKNIKFEQIQTFLEASKQRESSRKIYKKLWQAGVVILFSLGIYLFGYFWFDTKSEFNEKLSKIQLKIQQSDFNSAETLIKKSHKFKWNEFSSSLSIKQLQSRQWLQALTNISSASSVSANAQMPFLIYTQTLSFDKTYIVLGGENNTIILKNINKHIDYPLPAMKKMNALVFSPTENDLLGAQGSSTTPSLLRWILPEDIDFKKKILLEAFPIEHRAFSLAYSPDGGLLAYAGEQGKIYIKNAQHLEKESTHTIDAHIPHDIYALAFSSDGKWLASGSSDKTVKLWKTKDWSQGYRFQGHTDDVEAVVFSSDAQLLASSDSQGLIYLWEVKTGEAQHLLLGHQGKVSTLAFIEQGQYLVSAGADRNIRLWDVVSGRALRIFQGHQGQITSLMAVPDSNTVYSVGYDNQLLKWDMGLSKQQQLQALPDAQSVKKFAFIPGKAWAIAGFDSGKVRLYDQKQAQWHQPIQAHEQQYFSDLSVHPSGTWIATSSYYDPELKLWQFDEGKLIQKEGLEHPRQLNAIQFSPDGRWLASSTWGGNIYLYAWKNRQAQLVDETVLEQKTIRSLSFDQQGRYLLAGGNEQLQLWDIKGHRLEAVGSPIAQADTTLWAQISSDGQYVARGGHQQFIEVFRVDDGLQLIARLKGHLGTVKQGVFTPSGQLVTVGSDATVRFWDLERQSLLFTLELPSQPYPPVPLEDFAFHCEPETCWLGVPLNERGVLALYDMGRDLSLGD